MSDEHSYLHGDRRTPEGIINQVFVGLIIGVIMSVVTAGATTWVTTQILDTKISEMDKRLTKVEDLALETKSVQDQRKWVVDGARRLIERDK